MKKVVLIGALGIVLVVVLGTFGYRTFFESDDRETARGESAEVVEPTDDSFLLGEFYFNQDEDPEGPYDLARARFYYMRALEEDVSHENQMLWYQLGRIDFLEGNFEDAIARFHRQYELFGDQIPAVHYMLGLAYGFLAKDTNSQEDFELAENNFKEYIALTPGEPWPYVDLAWVYFMQGKYDDMEKLLSGVVSEYEENAWINNMYGLALHNSGNSEAARAYFEKSLAVLETLTPEDWGRVYPGNNPESWSHGLAEMKRAVEENIQLTNTD